MTTAVDNPTSSNPPNNLISPIAWEVAVRRGIPVIPIPHGSKACKLKDWPSKATTSTSTLANWHRVDATYNYGAVARLDGICILDFDSSEAIATCEKETGRKLPRTLVVKSAKGCHCYFKHTDASTSLGNCKWVCDNVTMFDFQAKDKYVIAPGSLHPSGIRYEAVDDSEIIPIPDWLVDWIRSKARGHEPENRHGGKGDVPNAHRRLFEDWLVQHNVDFTLTKQESESHTYGYRVNSGCPLAERHTNSNGPDDFYVFLSSDGYGAKCMHTSCGEWTWGRYRSFLEESDGKRIPLQAIGDDDHSNTHFFDSLDEGIAAFNQRFCYIRKDNLVVRLEDLAVFEPKKFASTQYANYYFRQSIDSTTTKTKQVARQRLSSSTRKELDGMTFAPGQPSIVEGQLNRWRNSGSEPAKGDIRPWLELIAYLFPHDPPEKQWFVQWLAYPIQHPGAKLKTAVVLIGLEGIGKNSVILPVERIYGEHAVNIGESELYDNFCPWKKDRQLIVGNEVHGGRDKRQVMDKWKDLITSPVTTVNEKFIPQYQLPNVANFIFTTNHPDPFYLAEGDRRFFVWNIPQEQRLSAEFFTRFYKWAESEEGIAALHYYLLHLPLDGFNPNANAPMTEAKVDMIELGRTRLELFLRDKIDGPWDLYTVDDLLVEFDDRNFGENAVRRTLLLLKCPKAYNGKQLKLNGRTVRLWILAEGAERDRLLAIKEPSHLAEEWNREREQTRGNGHGTEKPITNGTNLYDFSLRV